MEIIKDLFKEVNDQLEVATQKGCTEQRVN